MTDTVTRGDAYHLVKAVYDQSPGRSWRRLNGALHGALKAAIVGHLSFLPDDFTAIRRDTKGGYWLGDGGGSELGERYYDLAVEVGHTAACVAFEKFSGRPAILWSEDVKTPERLHVGSRFTWAGLKLNVTSLKSDHLIGCTYKGHEYRSSNGIFIGDFETLGDRSYRQIEQVTSLEGGGVTVRFGAPLGDPHSRVPDRVVKVTYAELAATRKRHDAARKAALKDVADAATLDDLVRLSTELAANATTGVYRHFDIEDIRNAITAREKALGFDREEQERREAYAKHEAADLDRWASGAIGSRFFNTVRLRVRNGCVETSTGQRASVRSVRMALPIILRRRASVGPVANLMVDSFRVTEQSERGVQVGCTLIPWSEVESLSVLLGVPQ